MATQYGRGLKETEFLYDPDRVFLNHGSCGGVPKRVLQHQFRLKELVEQNPDEFYRSINFRSLKENLEALCDFIGASVENTVFVENLTTGMNTVVKSLNFKEGDAVLITNLTFNTVKVLTRESALKQVVLQLDLPLSKSGILDNYEECLKNHPHIKLAILDFITSPSAVVMPVREIAALCHSYDVMVAVDGAHACGHIPLHLEDLGVDFFSGNVYKWMYSPRGCGFLWTSPKYRHLLRPPVVSHFHGVTFHFDHCVRGTRDDTPYHCMKKAIEFQRETLGGYENIHKYVTGLLDGGIKMLEKSWNTSTLPIEPELQAPFMRLIKVPHTVRCPRTPAGAADLEEELNYKHKIRIICTLIEDEIYMRISANVYNDMDDFKALEEAILNIMKIPQVPTQHRGYDVPVLYWDLSPLVIEYSKV